MAIKPKKVKVSSTKRSKYRIRKKLSGTNERPRLSIFKSDKYTYAQVISDVDGKTLISASTRDKEVMGEAANMDAKKHHNEVRSTKSVLAARAVGMQIGKKCKEKNIETAVFDRNGMRYAGRVKAVADGARAAGLKI